MHKIAMAQIAALSMGFLASATALADTPHMGGEMKHIMVHLHGTDLEGHVDMTVPTPIMTNYGETYTGNASVLNGTMYNAQYGWMKEGVWAPPAGSFLWIEQIDATAGLRAYLGGMMSKIDMHTFEPIFGTDGSSPRIKWDGMMLHNWYAVDSVGDYEATYRLYFGDENGVATPGYGADEVTLNWTAVPAPASLCVSLLAPLGLRRRRA